MNDNWNLMSGWDLILPPSRPSVQQLNELKQIAVQISRDNPVAILGATPEFRDLFFELGFKNIYVFDRNEHFYQQISNSRVYTNSEIFVNGDWLNTIEKYDNFFSLIVSDLTMGNVQYDKRKKFYDDISNALKQNGYFYDKVLFHQDNFRTIVELIEKYEKLPVNLLTVNYFSCEFIFCSELLKSNLLVETEEFYNTIIKQTANKKIHKFVELSKIITPPNCIWYYGKNWNEIKNDYCSELSFVNEMDDETESPYFGYLKILTLKK
jgi:phospholipid N-methyltransferase